MWGNATEAMDVSSTSMNVGSMTEIAISHGLQSGHQSCSGLSLSATGTPLQTSAQCNDLHQPKLPQYFIDLGRSDVEVRCKTNPTLPGRRNDPGVLEVSDNHGCFESWFSYRDDPGSLLFARQFEPNFRAPSAS